jgi:peptide deformylase
MQSILRIKLFLLAVFLTNLCLTGCATGLFTSSDRVAWPEDEQRLLAMEREDFDIVVRGGEGSQVLRSRARPVPAGADLANVATRMENTMNREGGVGIAAPQVGLSLRMAILMVDYKTDHPYTIAVCNPLIVERSDETRDTYEGCLSVPDVGGLVRRNQWIRVEYFTLEGERKTETCEGPNAVLWQHELDHLDGILYVDRLIGDLLPWEEVTRLRLEAEEAE